MTEYKTIIVGTDFSPLAEVAAEAGARMARRFNAEALHLVHVVNTSSAAVVFPYAIPEAQLSEVYEAGSERALDRLKEFSVDFVPDRVHRSVRLGLPARVLAEAAEELNADLLVVASHGFGPIQRSILGSVSGALIRSASCPVMVVGEQRHASTDCQNVLAAVDLSSVSESVIAHAVAMTQGGGHVVALSLYEHPLSTYDEGDLLPRYLSDDEVAQIGEKHRGAVQALIDRVEHPNTEIRVEVMSKAPPAEVVLETAAILNPDLIVVGTSGHNAWHRMIIGSTATKVLAEAPCPVLVVPHDPALPPG